MRPLDTQNTPLHATNGHLPAQPQTSSGSSNHTDHPDLRAHFDTDPRSNLDASDFKPQKSQNPNPASPSSLLPDHVDTGRLLFDYFESINLLDLANLHDVALEDLVTWTEHPRIIKQLARLRAANARRAEDIRAHSAAAAAAALYHIVRNPKYMSEHISIPAELRHMEIVVKVALAILSPYERTKTFLRALRLRRSKSSGAGFHPARSRRSSEAPRPLQSQGARASSPRRLEEPNPRTMPQQLQAPQPSRLCAPQPPRTAPTPSNKSIESIESISPALQPAPDHPAPPAHPRQVENLPHSQQRAAARPRDLIAGAGALPRAP